MSRADFSTAQMREKKSTLAPDSVTKRSYTVIRYSALMGTQFSMFFLTWGTPFLDSSNIFSASPRYIMRSPSEKGDHVGTIPAVPKPPN